MVRSPLIYLYPTSLSPPHAPLGASKKRANSSYTTYVIDDASTTYANAYFELNYINVFSNSTSSTPSSSSSSAKASGSGATTTISTGPGSATTTAPVRAGNGATALGGGLGGLLGMLIAGLGALIL